MIRKNPGGALRGRWGLTVACRRYRQLASASPARPCRQLRGCPGQPRQILAMAVKAQVTAASASCLRPGGPGVGSRAVVGCRARYRIPPGPGRGHQLGHGARTSGGCGTAAGPGSKALGRHPRAEADAGGTIGQVSARRQATMTLMRPPRIRARAAADSPRCPPGNSQREAPWPLGTGATPRVGLERQGLPPARQHHGTDPGRGWTAPSPVPNPACGKPADRAGKTGHSLASPSTQSPVGCSLMPMSGLDIPVLCGRRSRGAATEEN